MAIKKWKIYFILLDIALLLVAGILLYYGTSWQFVRPGVDATIYQCYATAFWQGTAGLQHISNGQCDFLNDKAILNSVILWLQAQHVPHAIIQFAEWQNSTTQFHTLPREYPIVTLIPFSVPLLAPAQFYQQAYAIWALLFVALLYFVILRSSSRWHALIFLVYMVVAGWSTAASRFDTFPAGLTLCALLLAKREKWKLAYLCIILATLLKFYPVVLLVPLFIAQQKQFTDKWYAWCRWKDVSIGFVGVFVGIMLVSLLVSIPGTLGALDYFTARPLEVESLPGSFVWLGHFFGFPYHVVLSFVSQNIVSSLTNKMSILSSGLLIVGLLYTFWLQYRGKLDMNMAVLLVLSIMLITSKVFSPQYMIWIIPLVAYVGKVNWRWIIPWGTVMVLTYYIYPVVYNISNPPPTIIFPLSMARGLIILGFVVVMLYRHTMFPTSGQPGSSLLRGSSREQEEGCISGSNLL